MSTMIIDYDDNDDDDFIDYFLADDGDHVECFIQSSRWPLWLNQRSGVAPMTLPSLLR